MHIPRNVGDDTTTNKNEYQADEFKGSSSAGTKSDFSSRISIAGLVKISLILCFMTY